VSDPTHSPSDEDLLAAAGQGDAASLEALIVRYQPRVFRFGMKMCGHQEDAGDVVQETMLAMARSVRDFRGDSSVSTWLYTIARSFCIKKRRRSKFAPAHEESLDRLDAGQRDELSDAAPDPEQAALGREIDSAVTAAIDALEAGQREVLVLRDVEGLSAPEVGKVLGLSVGAVKSRLHRARQSVRQSVAPLMGTPAGATPDSTCPDVVALFSRHLEGEITPDVCAQMESHLTQCGGCRDACESLRRTIAICRATRAPEIPTSVANAVRDAVRSFERLQMASGARSVEASSGPPPSVTRRPAPPWPHGSR
jgi:RNA polymerase sigma-70 factor (ECF subfamily)